MRRVRQASLDVDDYPTGKLESLRYGHVSARALATMAGGFTLIELVIILMVVGVLAVAALPRFLTVRPSMRVVFTIRRFPWRVTDRRWRLPSIKCVF